MKVQVESYQTVDPGQYDATFKAIESKQSSYDGENRSYWLWTFEIDNDGEPVNQTGTSSTKFSSKSKAYAWASALLRRGPTPDETIDFDELVGLPCRLILDLDEKGEYNVIEKVLPAKGREPDQSELEAPW